MIGDSARRLHTAVRVAVILLVLGVVPTRSLAIAPTDLPPSLGEMPLSTLVGAFSIPFEPPSLAAELARHHAWAPPTEDEAGLAPVLAQVIRNYPGTADARRALLDIAGIYARKGDWVSAEAPFRYVMEVAKGRPEARIAHLRLAELYSYAGAPAGVDAVEECRAAAADCAGHTEEGFARMALADVLAENGRREEALREFAAMIERFPDEPYSGYARVRYALALAANRDYLKACEVVAPVIERDRVWTGRAHWARGQVYAAWGRPDQAISDLRKGAQTADSVWIRGDCYARLGRLYAERGQAGPALASFQSCMALSPSRPDRLDTLIAIVRALFDSGRYLEAAETATGIEMEVTNSSWRYTKEDMAKATSALDPIIHACEAAVAGEAGAPAPEDE